MWDVAWLTEADADLARIWTAANATDRRQITQSINRIDRLLSEAPLEQGESRRDQNRITFASPMGRLFRRRRRVAARHRAWRVAVQDAVTIPSRTRFSSE